MTWIEAIAVVFGLACVWLTVRQSIWCWSTGLVQVVLFIFIFLQARLYSDVILHCIYVVLQVYGWHHWLYGGPDHQNLRVSRLSRRGFLGWVLLCGVGTAALGWSMTTFTDAALPYPDAFTTVASLIAQWLLTRKKLESWLFWIIVDVVAIGIYFSKSLFLTTGLYAVFLLMATMGLLAWRKSMKAVKDENGIDAR